MAFTSKHNYQTEIIKSLLSGVGQDKDEFFNVKSGIGMAAAEFIKRMKSNIEKDETIATGKLDASVQPELPIKHFGKNYQLVFLAEDYWQDVDQGTKAKGYSKSNMAQLVPQIQKWIVAKKGLRNTETEKKRLVAASRISKAILKKGTIKRFAYKGSGYFSKEINKFMADLQKELTKELGKDVKIFLQKIDK